MDSEYLKTHVGHALSLGLSEVCQKRPIDPIDFLANWLRKYVVNEENRKQDEKDLELLQIERERALEDQKLQQAMLEEQNQIANEILKRDMEKTVPVIAETEEKSSNENAELLNEIIKQNTLIAESENAKRSSENELQETNTEQEQKFRNSEDNVEDNEEKKEEGKNGDDIDLNDSLEMKEGENKDGSN